MDFFRVDSFNEHQISFKICVYAGGCFHLIGEAIKKRMRVSSDNYAGAHPGNISNFVPDPELERFSIQSHQKRSFKSRMNKKLPPYQTIG
jgi:hypothetical protein